MIMLRSAASKAMSVGRFASAVFGLALVLALMFGVTSVALAANGQPFLLGRATNAATALTKLTGNVNGAAMQVQNTNAGYGRHGALSLTVQAGEAPMRVNSDARVANLNADKIDGKDSDQIGVNGLERVFSISAFNSESPKTATVFCPAGKRVVGTGYDIFGATEGSHPNQEANIVVDKVLGGDTSVVVEAYEEEPTALLWRVTPEAFCAPADTP